MKIFIFLILIFYSLPANAYVDPGTGSIILQILFAIVAAVGSGYYFLKSKIVSFFKSKKKNKKHKEDKN